MSYFHKQAAAYAEFRPDYPDELFRFIASLVTRHDVAWDCATGNGQAATGLARHFKRVIATDVSAEQISHARPQLNVDYRVAPAESSGLVEGSVDAVTVCQALHWLDRPRFFAEARRVLAPGGALVVTVYGDAHISDNAALDELLQHFSKVFMRDYWPADRKLVDGLYWGIDFQHGNLDAPFSLLPAPAITLSKQWTLRQLAGYMRSWSSTTRYVERHGGDPVATVEREMHRIRGNSEVSLQISWPFRIFAGHFIEE